jgi:protoheme IX farnesyltransferase
MGFAGTLYAITALILSIGFIFCAVKVLRDQTHIWPRRMFTFSLFYLSALFAILIVEKIIPVHKVMLA